MRNIGRRRIEEEEIGMMGSGRGEYSIRYNIIIYNIIIDIIVYV